MASYAESDVKLSIRADPVTKKLEVCCDTALEIGKNLNNLNLDELVEAPWFQDNTMLFKSFLEDNRSFVLCIFPPASGKSTTAQLFTHYLSKKSLSTAVKDFFDKCEFYKAELVLAENNKKYKKFRASAQHILEFDFNEIQGNSYSELQMNYSEYVQARWMKSGLSSKVIDHEIKTLQNDISTVWSSPLRLRTKMESVKGTLYVMLDSLDNMYHLIADLPEKTDRVKLCELFTDGITQLIHKNKYNVKTFCFGVSPYLVHEFRDHSVSCHYIGAAGDEALKYFSYQMDSIQYMIDHWQLDNISKEDCAKVAAFHYNGNDFVNPYICVSFLQSLHLKGAKFDISISPRSLWLKSVFQADDMKLMESVLVKGETRKEFQMAVSMQTMCTIGEKTRKLYYPLFIYGGYFSCKKIEKVKKEDEEAYLLSYSNEVSKVLLEHHLKILYTEKFTIPLETSSDLLDDFLKQDYDSFCNKLSKALLKISSHMHSSEMKYHLYVSGIFHFMERRGYEIDNDKEYGGIKPDTTLSKDGRIIVLEYKHVKIEKNAKKSRGTPMKSQIVGKCQSIVKKACEVQLISYAANAALESGNDVKINLMLFYENHVILLHFEYCAKKREFTNHKIYSSTSYYDATDLKNIEQAATSSGMKPKKKQQLNKSTPKQQLNKSTPKQQQRKSKRKMN